MISGYPGGGLRRHVARTATRIPTTTTAPFGAHGAPTARSATATGSAPNEARAQLRARVAAFFRDFDVLLMPVDPGAGDPARPQRADSPTGSSGERRRRARTSTCFGWISLATLSFLPATVAPVGRTPGGLPVGVQIVGPYLEDRTTLAAGRAIAEVLGGFTPPAGY